MIFVVIRNRLKKLRCYVWFSALIAQEDWDGKMVCMILTALCKNKYFSGVL